MNQTSLKTRMFEAFKFRIYFFIALVALSFFILALQLFNLQIINRKDYQQRAKLNRESNIPILAARGEIFDRNVDVTERRYVVASSRPSFNVTTIPSKFPDRKTLNTVMGKLSKLLNIPIETINAQFEGRNRWDRVTIVEDVDFNAILSIAAYPESFPHIDWEDAAVRVYNSGNATSHIIGYIGSISKSEYRSLKSEGYKYYQKIGKFGLEKQYDRELRGTDGFIRRIVDVRNRTENEEVGQRPIPGDNLVLTIDAAVQNVASEAMGDLRGAVVVIKASTGEVLALLSKPDYDPNLIISRDNRKKIAAMNADRNKPFLNRAIQSAYPPASTFKLVNAIAALETDRARPNLRFFCNGKFTLRGYVDKEFVCFGKHHSLDMNRAIADSCNVYFYQLGYKIGPSAIMRYADYFGYNDKTEIDLPGEIAGFVPSKKWKMKAYNQPWFDGDTINLSIGQGFTTVTPIETCNLICAIVNDGVIHKPYLLKELRSADNNVVRRVTTPEVLREIPLAPETLATVKLGMRNSVVNGTSARLNWLKVQAAGKTGTVQTRADRKDLGSQHAWFLGYAPYDGDQEKAIAVSIFVEYGIAGATSAVPIAEKIFAKLEQLGYFK